MVVINRFEGDYYCIKPCHYCAQVPDDYSAVKVFRVVSDSCFLCITVRFDRLRVLNTLIDR